MVSIKEELLEGWDGASQVTQSRRIPSQYRRRGFHPWVRKILCRWKQQPTPVFSPGKIPWREEPGGLQSMGLQRVEHDLVAKQQQGWDTDSKRRKKKTKHKYENKNRKPRGTVFTL